MEKPAILTPTAYDQGILWGDREQPKQSVVTENASQQHALGTKLVFRDGRVYRYCKNGGTALSKAYMCTSEALMSQVTDKLQNVSGANIAVGDEEFVMDVTSGGTWVENEFAEGFLVVNKGTGIGDSYKIIANKIRSTDTLMDIRLEGAIRTALDATSEITLVKSPWRDVDVMPTTAEGTPAGVPLIDVTANYYFWAQTGGYTAIYVDTGDALIKGEPCGYPESPAVAGAVGDINAHTDSEWGIVVSIATAGEVAMVDLKLDS